VNKYNPKTKQELYLFKYFDTKTDIAQALKVTRPTLDKICSDPITFVKYAADISKVVKEPFNKVLKHINNGL